jgi:peptide/nickel transport system substrate-binding protein
LKAGELDWFAVAPAMLAAVQGDPNIVLLDTLPSRYIMLDLQLGPALDILDEPEACLALYYGVDGQAILHKVGLGRGKIQDSILFAVPWAFNPDIKRYPYDPDRALKLLASIGWKDTNGDGILDRKGEPFKLTITTDKGESTREQVGLILQQTYKKLGMDVDYEVVERGVYVQKVFDHTFHTRLTTRPASAISDVARFYRSGANANYGEYRNREADVALEAANSTNDREKQKQAYFKLQGGDVQGSASPDHLLSDDPCCP